MTLLLQSPSFELWWEPQKGTFRLQSPGRSLEGFAGVEVVHRKRVCTLTSNQLSPGRVSRRMVEDAQGQAEEIHVHYQETMGLALCLRLRLYPSRPFVLARVSVTNVGPDPVLIRRFFLRTVPGGLKPTTPPTGFYRSGWQSWSHAGFMPADSRGINLTLPLRLLQGPMIHNAKTPWPKRTGRFWSESVGALVTPREALVAGAVSLADQFAQVWADVRAGHEALMVQSQADDVVLTAAEARSSEWFYLEWVALPNVDPLAQYATAVAREMQVPQPRPAPAGWCSWYIFWADVSEENVVENMASAALLADELPMQVIQLDEGFEETWGDWGERNARFPHKLGWLADRIRGSGFTPGLWLAPLTAHPKSDLAREHPDWLLHNRRGRPVSAGLIFKFNGRALDPTHPGVEDYLRDLITKAVDDWGFPYLKLDFMYAGALPGKRHNPRLTRAQAMRNAFRIIREAAGEETYLVGCGAPLGPAIGLVDAMRIGPDTAPEWAPNFMGAGRVLQKNPSLPSLRNSLRNVASRAWIHDRWWTNDPDTLMVRDSKTHLTPDEVLAQVTLLGLSNGLLMLSDDLSKLPPERRAWAEVLLPPLLDGMDVLDLFVREMPEEVIVPVARPWGRWRLVGLFNWRDEPVQRSLPASLPLGTRKAYHLVDFWKRKYFRLAGDGILPDFQLPPHSAALLAVRSVRPAPQLVATTFHISQGGEVTDYRATSDSLQLTLDIGRLAQGEVWLALPERPKIVRFNDERLPENAITGIAPGIWSIACHLNRVGDLTVVWGGAT